MKSASFAEIITDLRQIRRLSAAEEAQVGVILNRIDAGDSASRGVITEEEFDAAYLFDIAANTDVTCGSASNAFAIIGEPVPYFSAGENPAAHAAYQTYQRQFQLWQNIGEALVRRFGYANVQIADCEPPLHLKLSGPEVVDTIPDFPDSAKVVEEPLDEEQASDPTPVMVGHPLLGPALIF